MMIQQRNDNTDCLFGNDFLDRQSSLRKGRCRQKPNRRLCRMGLAPAKSLRLLLAHLLCCILVASGWAEEPPHSMDPKIDSSNDQAVTLTAVDVQVLQDQLTILRQQVMQSQYELEQVAQQLQQVLAIQQQKQQPMLPVSAPDDDLLDNDYDDDYLLGGDTLWTEDFDGMPVSTSFLSSRQVRFLQKQKNRRPSRKEFDELEQRVSLAEAAVETIAESVDVGFKCFDSNAELRNAVNLYMQQTDPANANNTETEVAQRYGYPINSWCVSRITNFDRIFYNAHSFNEAIFNWDTSNAVSMVEMFAGAYNFDRILTWNVERVVDFSYMFHDAISFNQYLNWNPISALYMDGMFAGAASYNKPLGHWDTSTVISMNHMFYEAWAFDQPLDGWEISQVQDFGQFLYDASSFSQSLCQWIPQIGATPALGKPVGATPAVDDMFANTNCPDVSDPALDMNPTPSFCSQCNFYDGNGHYYEYFDGPMMRGWDEAHAFAQTLSFCDRTGHLVTIADEGENEYVRSLIQVPIHIGLHDKTVEGTFEWVTGEPNDYTNFFGPETDADFDKDCVSMNQIATGQWKDIACEGSVRAFVIEYDCNSAVVNDPTIPDDVNGDSCDDLDFTLRPVDLQNPFNVEFSDIRLDNEIVGRYVGPEPKSTSTCEVSYEFTILDFDDCATPVDTDEPAALVVSSAYDVPNQEMIVSIDVKQDVILTPSATDVYRNDRIEFCLRTNVLVNYPDGSNTLANTRSVKLSIGLDFTQGFAELVGLLPTDPHTIQDIEDIKVSYLDDVYPCTSTYEPATKLDRYPQGSFYAFCIHTVSNGPASANVFVEDILSMTISQPDSGLTVTDPFAAPFTTYECVHGVGPSNDLSVCRVVVLLDQSWYPPGEVPGALTFGGVVSIGFGNPPSYRRQLKRSPLLEDTVFAGQVPKERASPFEFVLVLESTPEESMLRSATLIAVICAVSIILCLRFCGSPNLRRRIRGPRVDTFKDDELSKLYGKDGPAVYRKAFPNEEETPSEIRIKIIN